MNVPALTGIRGVAALWVVLFHMQVQARGLGLPIADLPILRDGWAGVDLFFVLSGFILTLVHAEAFQTLNPTVVGHFAKLRFLRVYPLAIVTLLLIAALVVLAPEFAAFYAGWSDPPNLTAVAFVRTLTLSTRWFQPFDGDWNQPTWSLSVELLGYLAFPGLAMIALRLRSRWAVGTIALALLAMPLVVALVQGRMFADDIYGGALVRMAGGFAGGVALGRLHMLTPERVRALQGAIADIALLVVLALLLSPLRANGVVIAFGALIWGIASGRGVASFLFGTAPSMLLGRLSFPLYLIHLMPLMWMTYTLVSLDVAPAWRWAAVAVYAVGILALAYVLHVTVERPSQRWARR